MSARLRTGARRAAIGACLAAAATPLAAQSTELGSGICYRGRPAPRCRAFVLTEAAYYHRLGGTESVEDAVTGPGMPTARRVTRLDLTSHVSWEVGGMVNVNAATALGGSLLVGTGDEGARVGVKGRVRRWLGPSGASVDLAAGLLRVPVSARPSGPTAAAYGVGGDVSFGWGDLAAVSVRAEAVRADGRTAQAAYAGVRLGSYPAVIASAAGGLLLVLLIASLGRADF